MYLKFQHSLKGNIMRRLLIALLVIIFTLGIVGHSKSIQKVTDIETVTILINQHNIDKTAKILDGYFDKLVLPVTTSQLVYEKEIQARSEKGLQDLIKGIE